MVYAVRLFSVSSGFVLRKGLMGKLRHVIRWLPAVLLSAFLLSTTWQKIQTDQNMLELSFYRVKSEKAKEGSRIVQLSDLHPKKSGEKNQDLIERANASSPDIIVVTEGVSMEHDDDYHMVLDPCRQLVGTTGVYYVIGNHELVDYVHRKTGIRDDIERTGVHTLFNHAEMVQVNGNEICVGGLISEPHDYVEHGRKKFVDEYVRSESLKLLLIHYPEYFMGELEDMPVDLALYGHTHGEIVRLSYIGGIYATERGFFPPFIEGQREANGSMVIVSRGLGESHKIPRVNSKPGIVIVDINWY